MEKKYKISIITPIFNSEKYISRTIDSIINQTIGFQNLELILVDDKSTDNTKYVIENYAQKYDNIMPIYLTENSGTPGHGRNIGLDIATSDYIMFIDSDDEYAEDMCETLYNTLINEKCDLVGCSRIDIDNLTKRYDKFDGENEKIYIYPEDFIYYKDRMVWNKIFKKSIIDKNNIRFITDKVGEDVIFAMEYFFNSNLIIHLNNYYGYKYYNVGDSFSTKNMKWVLNVIEHNYNILTKFYTYLKNADVDKVFQNNIPYLNYSIISLEENDWKSLKKVITEMFKLEKKVGYQGKYEKNFLYKIMNKLIISNHLNIATLYVYILNRIHNSELILKIYRNIILKDELKK